MAAQDQYIQLSSLPEDVRKQVLDFIELLMKRREEKPQEPQHKKRRVAGLMKGQIHIADDFDAPLDDFKEYM
jgi:hypothetical protein